eukprot:scaffold5_cov331-Pavlova_lutheri.AAC.47
MGVSRVEFTRRVQWRRPLASAMASLRAAWASQRLPLVALVGRPNVGKSTLFNRLCRSRRALVKDTPTDHVTRDFREGTASFYDLRFRVLDTAGLEPYAANGSLQERGTRLTQEAMKRCDVALWLVDAKSGLTSSDESSAHWIRKHVQGHVPVLAVLNKCDTGWDGVQSSDYVHATVADVARCGFEDAVAIAAESGQGMVELYQRLRSHLDRLVDEDGVEDVEELGERSDTSVEGAIAEDGPLQLAIVGLPNAGKSTLVNRLLGEERCMTGSEPGTTRDTVRARFVYEDRKVWLLDTAGWMRRAKAMRNSVLSGLSMLETRRSIRNAHVVALLVEATREVDPFKRRGMLVRTELSLANLAIEEGKALVVVVNKLDALPVRERKQVTEHVANAVERMLPQVSGLHVVGMSAKTGAGVSAFMPAVLDAYDKWNTRLGTSALNKWLLKLTTIRGLSSGGGSGIVGRIKYLTQVRTRPPTFAAFATRGTKLEETQLRSLASSIRAAFELSGVPLRVLARTPPAREAKHAQ